MPKRRAIAIAQCPRLSDTHVYCIQAAKDIVKLLSLAGSRIILVS